MEEKYKKDPTPEEMDLEHLNKDQREIVKLIIKNNGKIYQSVLVREVVFSKVKVSRIIKELEEKNIIQKKKFGMTNTITLVKK